LKIPEVLQVRTSMMIISSFSGCKQPI